MSLQGPAWPRCVRRNCSLAAHLRRPCILFFLAMTSLAPGSALAKCHKFSIWYYPKPQKCFTALAPPMIRMRSRTVLPPERIEIALPPLDWVECPPGDERLQGIAKLRALSDVPRVQ